MKQPRYTHIKNVDFKKLTWILSQRKNDLKLSEYDISKETGLSASGINNILRNRFNPSWRSMKAICSALKIDYKAAIEVCKIQPDISTGEPKTKIELVTMPEVETTETVAVGPVQGTLELEIETSPTRSQRLSNIIKNSFERQAAEYLLNLGYKIEKPVTVTTYVTL